MLYAGVGSRQTPEDVILYMEKLAFRLAKNGFILRSGAADGADNAFEHGCIKAEGEAEIWLPWMDFNGHRDTGLYPAAAHYELASTIHPAWESLGQGPKALHARNVGQILGGDLKSPVAFVVCWTPDGCESDASRTVKTGGTGTAVALASKNEIPVFNLCNPDAKARLTSFIKDCIASMANQDNVPTPQEAAMPVQDAQSGEVDSTEQQGVSSLQEQYMNQATDDGENENALNNQASLDDVATNKVVSESVAPTEPIAAPPATPATSNVYAFTPKKKEHAFTKFVRHVVAR